MKQTEYLEILFNDCGFTPSQKKAMLVSDYGVMTVSELSGPQKSFMIDYLLKLKAKKS